MVWTPFIKILIDTIANAALSVVPACNYTSFRQGRSDGGYIGIYTPPKKKENKFLATPLLFITRSDQRSFFEVGKQIPN